MQTRQERQAVQPHNRQPGRAISPASRWRTSAAVAAVLALIAVFALVIHGFAGTGHPTTGTHPHNPTTSFTHPGNWVKQYETTNQIIVAPSNSNVLYKLPQYPTSTVLQRITFQRSDDGGRTWHTYTPPSDKLVNDPYPYLVLQVSPLNTQTVFATIESNSTNPNCPAVGYTASVSQSNTSHSQPMTELAVMTTLSGGYSCSFQYVSTDGGNTWATPDVPVKGVIGQFYFTGGYGTLPPFTAQSNRLYAALAPDINGPQGQGFRLVSSSDSIHWSAADAPLAAQNLTVLEYAATSDGSTVFATTRPISTTGGTNREFWRSDDVGAHWTDLGAFPQTQDLYGMTYLMGAAHIGSKTVVYYATSSDNSDHVTGIAPNQVFASADNGKTWQAAPTATIPHGQRAAVTPIGTLDDGSLVLLFDTQRASPVPDGSQTANVTFYAWKLGAKTWTQLTESLRVPPSSENQAKTLGPSYGYDGIASVWLTPAHNGTPATIWALLPNTQGNGDTLWSCALG